MESHSEPGRRRRGGSGHDQPEGGQQDEGCREGAQEGQERCETEACQGAQSESWQSRQSRSSKPSAARDGSKKAEVIGLLQRKGGATLTQIMKATGWQAHSVRGFISGALGKKMGLTVESAKREDGERVYSIA